MHTQEQIHKNFIKSIFEFSKIKGYSVNLYKKKLTTDTGAGVGFEYPLLSVSKDFIKPIELSEVPSQSFYAGEKEDCYYMQSDNLDDDDDGYIEYPFMYENYIALDLKFDKSDVRDFIFYVFKNSLDNKEEVSLLKCNLNSSSSFDVNIIIDPVDTTEDGMKNELMVLATIPQLESFLIKRSIYSKFALSDLVHLFKNKSNDYKLSLVNLFPEKKFEGVMNIPYDFKDFVFKLFDNDIPSIKKVAKKQKFLDMFLSGFDDSVDLAEIDYKKISLFFEKELYLMNIPNWTIGDYESYYSKSIVFVKDFLCNKKLINDVDFESSIKLFSMDIYFNPSTDIFKTNFIKDIIIELRSNKKLSEEIVSEKNYNGLTKFLDMWFLNNRLEPENNSISRRKQKI